MNFVMSAISMAVILDTTGQQKATPVMIKLKVFLTFIFFRQI